MIGKYSQKPQLSACHRMSLLSRARHKGSELMTAIDVDLEFVA